MAAFTDLDDLAVVMTGGGAAAPENVWAYKSMYLQGNTVPLSTSTGTWKSWWNHTGNPGYGTLPGTVAAPTSSTNGAIPFTNASGGRTKYVVQAIPLGPSNSAFNTMLYDRLLHLGNLTMASASSQTVGGTLTRNTGGLGNEVWIEVETGTAGTKDCTITYTNQAGTGSKTSTMEIGNGATSPGTLYRMPLAAGDTGVRSVESVQLASTSGSGTFGVVIANPLLMFGPEGKSMIEPPWPVVEDNACLALASRFTSGSPIVWSIMLAER